MTIARYLKEIGRGAAGSRSLSQQAAHDLMAEVLAGRAPAPAARLPLREPSHPLPFGHRRPRVGALAPSLAATWRINGVVDSSKGARL